MTNVLYYKYFGDKIANIHIIRNTHINFIYFWETNRLWPQRMGTEGQWGRNNSGDEPFRGRIDLKSSTCVLLHPNFNTHKDD